MSLKRKKYFQKLTFMYMQRIVTIYLGNYSRLNVFKQDGVILVWCCFVWDVWDYFENWGYFGSGLFQVGLIMALGCFGRFGGVIQVGLFWFGDWG